jgi:hypothetical protein
MQKSLIWKFAKLLEGVGLVVVLVGVLISINLGFDDQGLASMAQEFQGLMVGGAIFIAGYLLERWAGTR